ncbi:protein-export chaperone SecB [Conchiformibius steedae DSM 2580]|uniref:Protein-export chaperone SecB n=1 Tax=Conchiformibius steedae DSM 2580 TaxID=1121352 RepID=A0AAE9HXP1_9NEIS|nr:protein-export chaperone SecB [Conchiformibius steedae]QMT33679.1 protein-export chaperone SecB [Conchiformibius steedae]URD68340.1 protein-export chaperone SecB [Conchiformibius steedae DSM 2580]
MNIRLVGYRVMNTVFNASIPILDTLSNISNMEMNEYSNSMNFDVVYPEHRPKDFFVLFNINLMEKDKMEEDSEGLFSIKFLSHFECDQDIDDKFKKSDFPIVNAPAIAYPFVRAFVNNYFINAGYEPVLLPTYNFVKFKDKHRK